MDPGGVQCIFKETRLSIEPSSTSQALNISVPSPYRLSLRASTKTTTTHNAVAQDETSFRRKNLASASSVFYRTGKHAPRSFLWRVLEEGAVLSIRAVDVHREKNAPDAPHVLNFHFDAPVFPSCVALADSPDHDALYVYAIDQSLRLNCFTLRSDFFRKRSSLEGGLGDAHKAYQPSEITSQYPHRMYAVSPDLLVVALHDGSLVKLERNRPGDASGRMWREQSLNSSGWGAGIRSLFFNSKTTIKYGKYNLDYATTTSAQVTTLGVEGQLFLVTVCLDHRMRIWNLRTNSLVHTGDILDQQRNPQDLGKFALDPSQSTLVQVVGQAEGNRLCVTYSPLGAGEFKFWSITMRDANTIVVEDRFPGFDLAPVSPSSSDLWTLADYAILHPKHNDVQIWTLWKNNMTYRVQHLDAQLDSLDEYWESQWGMVYVDTSVPGPPESGPCEPTDVTEKWLQTILAPGRFTRATIDTALAMYERNLASSKDSLARGRRSVAESICTVISPTTTLERKSSGEADYDEFRNSNEKHWRQFYRLLVELDKQRGEALSLAFDADQAMPWVICVDGMSAIRTCSEIESTCFTLSGPSASKDASRVLVSAGLAFVDGFTDNLWQLCNSILRAELFTEPDKTDLGRIQAFYDASGLWRNLDPEDCQQVVETLGANYKLASPAAYSDLLGRISPSTSDAKASSRAHHDRPLTDFGLKLMVRVAYEAADLQWRVCFSQLMLLIHMEYELENDEDALHNTVDICYLFSHLISALRRLELVRWLSRTEVAAPVQPPSRFGASSSPAVSSSKKATDDVLVSTALEEAVAHSVGFGNEIGVQEPLTHAITAIVKDLCAADSHVEIMPTLIQASLIRKDRADLALDLAPFCDDEPFSVYVQGRVALALGDFDTAAANFRKAATGMSSKHAVDRHVGGLLDDTEKGLLHDGLASYYRHIVAVFERSRAYSYVIDFASLALQFHTLQPPPEQGAEPTKTEILSRLFNAAVKTARYELAHTSLQSMGDARLQASCLGQLVDRMCESGHSADMMTLPFGRLQPAVDDLLEQRCRSALGGDGRTPYHQILYAWRVRYSNYRGAATVLLDRIHKLRDAGEADNLLGEDGFDTPVTKLYLLLINALSCVDPAEAWIFSEAPSRHHHHHSQRHGGGGSGSMDMDTADEEGVDGQEGDRKARSASTGRKRKVVTLADVRKEYQEELDRISAIQNNQFGFDAGDAMDIMV